MALNRTKPYGEVYGGSPDTVHHRYEQGGKFYNAQFLEVDGKGNLLEEPVSEVDTLTAPKIRDALDKMGVDYDPKLSKPDLLAKLKEELAAEEDLLPVWRAQDPQGNEAQKVKFDIVPYTRGRGLDIGCGPFKVYPHFIGVDNGHHAKEFGWDMKPDIITEASDLSLFADQSLDFIFSSHLLEHIEDPETVLSEWWRTLKPGGNLVLYLPHGDLYPQVGTEGANPDHKHNLWPKTTRAWMKRIGGWDLLMDEKRDDDYGEGQHGNEYSFLQVYSKRTDTKHTYPCQDPKPNLTACVVRYGGIGDMIQSSSILPWLKSKGYHITMMTTPQGQEIVKHDPHIDAFILQDKEQVPNNELRFFWQVWEQKFDKFINLSETVEVTLLAMPGSSLYQFPKSIREKMLDTNYLEMTHDVAEIPHEFAQKYYPTSEEINWAIETKRKLQKEKGRGPVILWSLAGSSVHKTWPWLDTIVARLMTKTNAIVVTVGDTLCQVLETGWENEDRVYRRSGIWAIRESLAFAAQAADLVIGTETGLLNAVGPLSVPKIITLSHSSHENLTKHWEQTTVLSSDVDCYPCHQMHYDFSTCQRDEFSGVAACQAGVTADMMWTAIEDWMETQLQDEKQWQPPAIITSV